MGLTGQTRFHCTGIIIFEQSGDDGLSVKAMHVCHTCSGCLQTFMSPCLQGALEKMSSVAEEINKAFTEKVSELNCR